MGGRDVVEKQAARIDWSLVQTVLLDMDGTLLDLRFDNWFWTTLIPAHFARVNGFTRAQAEARLTPMFEQVAHTLPWYCIDHWSRELKLDIRALKREARAQVQFLPGAQAFLGELRRRGKRLVLVTNSHPETLAIKDEQVAVTRYFDACYSSHPFGLPKEAAGFWPQLMREEAFPPESTLFVDDSLPVLKSARAFGIAHLRAVRRPDSTRPPNFTGDFPAVDGVAELLP
jgi:putative hydrolase of the HAD superfamily